MVKGIRTVKYCKCGCGQLSKVAHRKNGAFCGYRAYADGHYTHQVSDETREKFKTRYTNAPNPRSRPVGSKRVQTKVNGDIVYIKVAEPNVWQLEHRVVAENKLGRKLDRYEHVKHLDGNLLNNEEANITVVPRSKYHEYKLSKGVTSFTSEAERKLRTWLGNKYDMSLEDYHEKLANQQGVCSICKEPPSSERRLCVDHDHTSGKIRGLLCQFCNSALGMVKDNTEILKSAISYLERNK